MRVRGTQDKNKQQASYQGVFQFKLCINFKLKWILHAAWNVLMRRESYLKTTQINGKNLLRLFIGLNHT